MKYIFSILLIISSYCLQCQTHFGDQWVSGGNWPFKIDFKQTPVNVNIFIDTPSFIWCYIGHSSICNSNGNLLLFSDGYNIYDSTGAYIEDGDTLVSQGLFDDFNGFSICSQTSLILPMGNNMYYLITPNATDSVHASWYIPYNPAVFDELLLHKIDMNANGGLGKKIESVKIMQQDSIMKSMMMACRHANGKDWWLLKQMSERTGAYDGLYPLCKNKIAKILITKDSIYPTTYQYFNEPIFSYFDQSGQAMFNQDGTKYVSTCRGTNKVFMADFDRCTGMLSNGKSINVPDFSRHDPSDTSLQDIYTQGLCFSPNGQFLYVNKFFNLLQYDLTDNDSSTAWYHIAGLDTTWAAFQKYSSSYIGPDNKIYVGNWWGVSKQMSVINNPNVKGVGCDFCPRCLRFPYAGASSPPNMPNYDLGAEPCWPLGSSELSVISDELVVYPNPASNKLIVKGEKPFDKIEIFNSLGQLVLTQKSHGTQVELDVSDIARGVYYLKCGIFTKKIVIE